MATPNIIGITGGIGSGKSSVAKFLCSHFGVTCFNADAMVHELLAPGMACWQIIFELDMQFVNQDQSINKPLLRKALFADASLRQTIDDRIHPVVCQALMKEVEKASACGENDFLIEVPLLFEAGWQEMFSAVIVVAAPERKCRDRIVDRDGVSTIQAEQSIESQMSLEEKIQRGDYVIDNSGPWDDTVRKLVLLGEKLWQKK